jgi:hypothetical protein
LKNRTKTNVRRRTNKTVTKSSLGAENHDNGEFDLVMNEMSDQPTTETYLNNGQINGDVKFKGFKLFYFHIKSQNQYYLSSLDLLQLIFKSESIIFDILLRRSEQKKRANLLDSKITVHDWPAGGLYSHSSFKILILHHTDIALPRFLFTSSEQDMHDMCFLHSSYFQKSDNVS